MERRVYAAIKRSHEESMGREKAAVLGKVPLLAVLAPVSGGGGRALDWGRRNLGMRGWYSDAFKPEMHATPPPHPHPHLTSTTTPWHHASAGAQGGGG